MKRTLRTAQIIAVATALGVMAGCMPPPLYDWGAYEPSLQASYVTHDDGAAWSGLEATVLAADQSGKRPPPGVCAEYGFMLYKRGRHDDAIRYFEREASLYPESKPLMDKLVAKVGERRVVPVAAEHGVATP